jgi:hypothetical protein
MKSIALSFIALLLFCELGNSQQKMEKINLQNQEYLKLIHNACITVYSWDNMHLCFKNGEYKKEGEDGEILKPIIFTKFNSNSSEYAIVPMSYWGGGSGQFYFILLFVKNHDAISQLSCADVLGSGILNNLRVIQDTVIVNLHDERRDDEDSVSTTKFLFNNNQLTELKKQ